MDTDSFIVYIKADDIYEDIAEDVKTRFKTSNYELDSPLPKRKNKTVIGSIKNELGGKIMIEFVRPTAKTYSYLIDNSVEDKTAKGTKKFAIKRKFRFENYRSCYKAAQLENKIIIYIKVKLAKIVLRKVINNL